MNTTSIRSVAYACAAMALLCMASDPALASHRRARTSTAVYTQTNGLDGNQVVAFRQRNDGTLDHIGDFDTGGLGSTEFDGGEGLDPLISADALVVTDNQRFLLTVNAGSDSITSFRINSDFTLTRVSTVPSGGVGPNSLATRGRLVFVTNIDRDGFALGDPDVARGEPNDEGNVVGFRISRRGRLRRIEGSVANLDNRPADVGFSRNGRHLIVSSITAGSAQLPGPDAENSVSVFGVRRNGKLTGLRGAAIGTPVGNREERNLASAIDFDVTTIRGREFVVVTEAREFNSRGAPPALPALQAGSVSVYELLGNGFLIPTAMDVAIGDPEASPFEEASQLTTCWIDFGRDGRTFFVSNAINATISSFYLRRDGIPVLLEEVAAAGVSGFENGGTTGPEVFGTTDGFIDLDVSDDGRYLYQLQGLSGAISVYRVRGAKLDLVDEVTGYLPEIDTQGIISVTRRSGRYYR
ncbi:MAG: beta-propeller fold lactonase family protein [Planctomycetota bacterium]